MTTKRVVKLISDPGHGWLSVRVEDIDALDIAHLISHFSFYKGRRVYLEEDADATLYLQAARDRGWQVTIKESVTNRWSWVRSLNRWDRRD